MRSRRSPHASCNLFVLVGRPAAAVRADRRNPRHAEEFGSCLEPRRSRGFRIGLRRFPRDHVYRQRGHTRRHAGDSRPLPPRLSHTRSDGDADVLRDRSASARQGLRARHRQVLIEAHSDRRRRCQRPLYFGIAENQGGVEDRPRPFFVARPPFYIRQGDISFQPRKASVAHAVPLSAWHPAQPFGIFNRSPSAGEINRNVCARTLTSAMVCSIFGMWQFTHSFPLDPVRWCVCCSTVAVCGPLGALGPWHSRHITLAGFSRSAWFAVPCTSWQLKHVTPRVYMTLVTKSFPCIRFLCAVPSAKCVNVVSPSLCSSSCQ